MSWASSEVVSVLVFLLPGFAAAAVFYSLTAYPKPNEFGQVVQALVFTTFIQIFTWGIRQLPGLGASWSIEVQNIVSVLSAVVFALVVAYFSNNDIPHRLLQRIGLTKENTELSEWYSSFAQNTDCYVILNLRDERRLLGWPDEWPSQPGQGHFRLIDAVWLFEDSDGRQTHTEPEIYAIVVPAELVETVEFLESTKPEQKLGVG